MEEAAKKVEPPPRGVPDDPAILAVYPPFFVPFVYFLGDEQLSDIFESELIMLISPLPSF